MPARTADRRAPGRREAFGGWSDHEAQTLALSALAFLLAEDDRAGRFLGATGLGGAELAGQVTDAAFLGGVLDFVLQDELLVIAVAEAANLRPERVATLRQRLPGAPPRE